MEDYEHAGCNNDTFSKIRLKNWDKTFIYSEFLTLTLNYMNKATKPKSIVVRTIKY